MWRTVPSDLHWFFCSVWVWTWLCLSNCRRTGQVKGSEQSLGFFKTVRIPVRRKYFDSILHLRLRARISCVLSSCWPISKLTETTWWTRSSKLCRRRVEQVKNHKWVTMIHRSGQSWGCQDRRLGEELGGLHENQIQVQQREFPKTRSFEKESSGRRQVRYAPSSTSHMWRPADGGTFARARASRERNGGSGTRSSSRWSQCS